MKACMTALMVSVGIGGSFMLRAIASELATEELKDGDAIVYLPLDSDFASISNADANVSTILTNAAAGGSVSFHTAEVEGQYVVDSLESGRSRDNGGYVRLNRARIGIDLSQFGIGYDCQYLTVEGYVRGTYPGSMADWGGVITMAVLDTSGNNANYVLLSPSASAKQMWMKMTGRAEGAEAKDMAKGVDGGFDGKWHHFAMTVRPMPAGSWAPEGSQMCCYLDHVDCGANENRTRWHGYTDAGEGKKMYLYLGNSGSTIEIDELRISKGRLAVRDFLRLRTADPKDGEAVFHLTFDDRNLLNSVATVDQPTVKSGTATYDTDVPSEFISAGRDPASACRSNKGSLRMDSSMLQLNLEDWLLCKGGMREMTLEFFIKGSAETRSKNLWGGPFRLADTNEAFPFLMQINDRTNYYFRADAHYWNGIGDETKIDKLDRNTNTDFHDGKWHHVALTVKEMANNTSRMELFFDHTSIGSLASENHAWRFPGRDGILGFGHANAGTVWIDEVRVSKGVLTKDQFLYARKGFAIFVR